MPRSISTYQTSNCGTAARFEAEDNGIGELFRDYGEDYMRAYQADLTQIKMIRSIRICKTPALGGTAYICKQCGKTKYVYFGCGNSRCPKCQGIKRMQWQDKLSSKLLKCPYVHMVFTIPHQLNNLARLNPRQVYNCLMSSAWQSLKICCADPQNLGALPGAIMVLHTFGADLKYHIHAHTLVTFGGIDNKGQWQWPKRRNKIIGFRQIRRVFKEQFIRQLKKIYPTLQYNIEWKDFKADFLAKQWCVHAEPPTTSTQNVEQYLSKYICRIGLSKKRFHYDQVHRAVTLTFKDYKNHNDKGKAPPLATKTLHPLIAIHKIMQHCLPPYFQKSRYYGLHASASYKKHHKNIPNKLKRNTHTIRTIFQIIKAMLGLQQITCSHCGHDQFEQQPISPNHQWKLTWLSIPSHNKDPVLKTRTYHSNTFTDSNQTTTAMPNNCQSIPSKAKKVVLPTYST